MKNSLDDPRTLRSGDDDAGSGDNPKTGLGKKKKIVSEAPVQEATSEGDGAGEKKKPKVGLGPRHV